MFHIFRWKVCPFIRGTLKQMIKDQCIGAKNTAFWPVEQTLIQKSIYKLKGHNQSRQTSTKDWRWLPNCKIFQRKLGADMNWVNSANETFHWKTAPDILHFSSFGGLFSSFFFCSGFTKEKGKRLHNLKINHSHCSSIFTKLFCLIGFLAPTFFFWAKPCTNWLAAYFRLFIWLDGSEKLKMIELI